MAGRFLLSKIEVLDFTSFFDFWFDAIDFDLPRFSEVTRITRKNVVSHCGLNLCAVSSTLPKATNRGHRKMPVDV